MNTRLQQFLDAENLTQAQFADNIGVARPGITHLLDGRNKPSFAFIEKMIAKYPDISLDWLITGKGRMYKTRDPQEPQKPEAPAKSGSTVSHPNDASLFNERTNSTVNPQFSEISDSNEGIRHSEGSLFEDTLFNENEETADITSSANVQAPAPASVPEVASNSQDAPQTPFPGESRIPLHPQSCAQKFNSQRHIRKILILYSDGTFGEVV